MMTKDGARLVKMIRSLKSDIVDQMDNNTERIRGLEDTSDTLFEFVEMFFFLFARATEEGVFLEDDAEMVFKKFVDLEEEYFAVLSVTSFVRKLR